MAGGPKLRCISYLKKRSKRRGGSAPQAARGRGFASGAAAAQGLFLSKAGGSRTLPELRERGNGPHEKRGVV